MVAMNGNDGLLSSGGAPGKDARRCSSIAWCAGGFPARHSAPNVFHRRPN